MLWTSALNGHNVANSKASRHSAQQCDGANSDIKSGNIAGVQKFIIIPRRGIPPIEYVTEVVGHFLVPDTHLVKKVVN